MHLLVLGMNILVRILKGALYIANNHESEPHFINPSLTDSKATRVPSLVERCMIRASVAAFRVDPWDIKICVHQLLVEFSEARIVVNELVRTRHLKVELLLCINEIGNNPDFLTSVSLDPRSHIKLQYPNAISGNHSNQRQEAAHLAHRHDIHVTGFIVLGNSL